MLIHLDLHLKKFFALFHSLQSNRITDLKGGKIWCFSRLLSLKHSPKIERYCVITNRPSIDASYIKFFTLKTFSRNKKYVLIIRLEKKELRSFSTHCHSYCLHSYLFTYTYIQLVCYHAHNLSLTMSQTLSNTSCYTC